MTDTTIDENNSIFQPNYNLKLMDTGTFTIEPAGYVITADSIGLALGSDSGIAHHTLEIDGTLSDMEGSGILAFNCGMSITVGQGGTIHGQSNAIAADVVPFDLTNNGSVTSSTGIAIDVTGAGDVYITNSGLIASQLDEAIEFDGTGIRNLVNSGVISAANSRYAYYSANSSNSMDHIDNSGTINGSIYTGGGDDRVNTGAGVVRGFVALGDGDDLFNGSDSSYVTETAYGGAGDDELYGAGGNDTLYGEADSDTVSGGLGNDYLDGGALKDLLIGGKGNDKFVFSTALGKSNIDTIEDFSRGNDKIALSHSVFTAASAISKGEVITVSSGHNAAGADDYFIYNKSNGTLWYDADGSGGGHSAEQFAVFDHKPPSLSSDDFVLVM